MARLRNPGDPNDNGAYPGRPPAQGPNPNTGGPLGPGGISTTPGGGADGPGPEPPISSSQGPREREPNLPQTPQPMPVQPPSPEGQMGGGGGPQSTPMMPNTPTPRGGVFYPPSPGELLGGNGNAFGKAGGLLNGGMGLPSGQGGGQNDTSDLFLLLQSLLGG